MKFVMLKDRKAKFYFKLCNKFKLRHLNGYFCNNILYKKVSKNSVCYE